MITITNGEYAKVTVEEIIEKLSCWGCDTNGALARTLGDRVFYVSLLLKYKDTLNLDALCELIHKGKAEEAFEKAHMIKGVLGNLGLTPMYNANNTIVESLRSGNTEGLEPYLDILTSENEKLATLSLG